MSSSYSDFLASKALRAKETGLSDVPALASHLFPFQRSCVDFALRAGSAGNFLSTGLGKTACELEWSAHAAEATNGKSLILAPLSVGWQIAKEAERWGYDARVIRDQDGARPGINICNYDRLDRLEPSAFGAVALDESSILKSFGGKTSRALIDAFSGHRFRLSATATPAPNDHMELGQQSDFLGVMPSSEMLMRWFINDTSTASQEWRLKRHAVNDFWDWCASWSRMAEMPSDLTGNPEDDSGYLLPPLKIIRHRAEATPGIKDGDLFGLVDVSASNIFDIKRQTAGARAKLAGQIVDRGISQWLAEQSGQRKQESKRIASTHCDGPITHLAGNIACSQSGHTNSQKTSHSGRQINNCDILSESNGRTTALCFSDKTGHAPFAAPALRVGMENSTSTTATIPASSADCSVITATSRSDTSGTTLKTFDAPPTISKAERIPAWVLWCDTNEEQNTLERVLGDLCISITGSQTPEQKEELHQAWLDGAKPVLISKPSIFGFGMNWQHCANMIFIGRSFSYETWYQAVRRCWRFGQKREVEVHLIVAEGEEAIARVIDRKADDHATMKTAMREAMLRATQKYADRRTLYRPSHQARVPSWL